MIVNVFRTGQRTVPNIFINGEHIGGASDTKKLHAEVIKLYFFVEIFNFI